MIVWLQPGGQEQDEVAIFRKPERIEYPALLLSVGCLTYVAFSIDPEALTQQWVSLTEVRAGLVLTVLCLAGEMLLSRGLYRIGALVAHLLILLVTLVGLGDRFIVQELLLVSVLILQNSLRLSVLRGLLLNAILLASVTLLGANLGSTIGDRAVVLLFGAFWAFVTGTIMYYREQVVGKSKIVEAQYRSLENLVAANHSFVEHLESVEMESAENERRRITRELHDEIGYAMTNISMMMNASPGLMRTRPEMLLDYCRKTREIATSTLRETRDTLYRLRGIEQTATQNPAVFFSRLCDDFAVATGITTVCHTGNLPGRLNDVVFAALLRGVQVGFINALRHGNAGEIRLTFWVTEDQLLMNIWNDVPLAAADSAVIAEGIGLKGMTERLEPIGGSLRYGALAGGFEFVVTIPEEEIARGIH